MTIVIWMSPEPGHVLPTIKFARDLQRSGVRVVYLSVGDASLQLKRLGFEVVQMRGFIDLAPCEGGLFTGFSPARYLYRSWRSHFLTQESYVEAFRKEFRLAILECGASLFLVDGIFDSILNLGSGHHLKALCKVVKIYIHLPYQTFSDYEQDSGCAASIYLCPPEFELNKLRLPLAHYTEASIFKQDGATMEYLDDGDDRPLIYSSFGSQAALYPHSHLLTDAMTRIAKRMPDCRFVIVAPSPPLEPDNGEVSDLRGSDNVIILQSAPQWQILQRAAVAVTHGGFSTIKECIFNKVPMLLCPQLWDQPMNAARISHHRLGLVSSLIGSEAELASTLSHLLEVYVGSNQLAEMAEYFAEQEALNVSANVCLRLCSM